ncbi:MAG: hypothetical protein JWQ01_4786 [Massilia sp.]|nr:hypothetical protein [Massilia sp.]
MLSTRPPVLAEPLEPRTLLASAVIVKDIIPGAETAVSLGTKQYAAVGDKLFFAAIDKTHGQELWVTDGTSSAHLVKDIDPGAHTGHLSQLVAGNGVVYFLANDGTGSQVWQSDGTDAHTKKVSTLAAADGTPADLTFVNGQLLFFGIITNSPALYRLNPAGGQTKIGTILLGGDFTQVVGNKAYFGGSQLNGDDKGLYVTDGTSVQFVRPFQILGHDATALGSQLIFEGFTDGNYAEPWQSSGTGTTTTLLKDLRAGDSSSPFDFTTVGSNTYFIADSGPLDANFQIYSTNGATVARITKLAATTTHDSIRDLTNSNGLLVFTYVPAGGQRLIYSFYGTKLSLICTAATTPQSPGFLTPVGKSLFFAGVDSAGHSRLYSTDGATISLVTGDAGTSPSSLTNVNGTLYFQASDTAHGGELHAVTGAGGTTPPSVDFHFHIKAKTTINEGQSFTPEVIIDDGPAGTYQYRWDFDGDGKLDTDTSEWGKKPSHLYRDNLKDNAPRRVRCKVIAPDGKTFKNQYIDVVVINVLPEIKIVLPNKFVAATPIWFYGSVSDVGPDDKLKITIDWGDKTPVESYTPVFGRFVGTHTFKDRNIFGYDQTIIVSDGSGKKDKHTTVHVLPALTFDANDPANKALKLKGTYVGGTSKNDRVKIEPSKKQPTNHKKQALDVTVNEVVTRVLIDVKSRISVFLGAGNDRAVFSNGIKAKISAYGDQGKDRFTLSDAEEMIFGGPDSDGIFGKPDSYDSVKL